MFDDDAGSRPDLQDWSVEFESSASRVAPLPALPKSRLGSAGSDIVACTSVTSPTKRPSTS